MADSIWLRILQGSKRFRWESTWAAAAPRDWQDRIMTIDVTDRFHAKQGRSTGRWILGPSGPRVYLKRHLRLPWWRGVLAVFLPHLGWSPAEQERRNLTWAQENGFQVPPAVASGEIVGPGWKLQSFLAVQELVGMLPLHEAIPLAKQRLDARGFAYWKRGLTAELARIAQKLHGLKGFHKDLYLCHFYIPEAFTWKTPAWTNQVYMIDLHRLGRHPLSCPVWQVKDLAELLYSSEIEGVTGWDRLRFWRHYAGQSRGTLWARVLRFVVVAKYRRYRYHNERKKARRLNANRDLRKQSA